jgi:hypothetical protein
MGTLEHLNRETLGKIRVVARVPRLYPLSDMMIMAMSDPNDTG